MAVLRRIDMYNLHPADLIPDAGAMQRFMELTQLYDAAIREVRTKLEILDREFQVRYARNPIHHIESRLKSPHSIAEKLERKGLPRTIDAAEKHLLDIAGVRIICNYVQDIYHVSDLLTRQRDVETVLRKDYIAEPKGNGYRSLHLVVRIPVFLSSHTELVPVEIQIRTIAMDFWASLEHELRYKSDQETNEALKLRLKLCAETSAQLDEEMQSIYQEIHGGKNTYHEKKVAEPEQTVLQS
ncbi:MAG: GTP pyrophosphokinase family protein [Clostridia bacterium]|nr:GTP pyrophosphokinase family protein [Clostridia bacterium]